MVIDAILGWLFGLQGWLLGLLPTSHLALPDFTAGYQHLFDLAFFLPIPELIGIVFAAYALGPAMLVTSIIAWLLVGVARGGSPTL